MIRAGPPSCPISSKGTEFKSFRPPNLLLPCIAPGHAPTVSLDYASYPETAPNGDQGTLIPARRERRTVRVAPDRYASYNTLYDTLVHHGRQRHPESESSGHRGCVKRDLAQNLLTRLETHRSEILAFFDDIPILFDNNAAERALCMMKVKLKISGSFRNEEGGRIFAAIRSYVVTARQQRQSPLTVLRAALAGHPWQPI